MGTGHGTLLQINSGRGMHKRQHTAAQTALINAVTHSRVCGGAATGLAASLLLSGRGNSGAAEWGRSERRVAGAATNSDEPRGTVVRWREKAGRFPPRPEWERGRHGYAWACMHTRTDSGGVAESPGSGPVSHTKLKSTYSATFLLKSAARPVSSPACVL
jgi:hypothetical protein